MAKQPRNPWTSEQDATAADDIEDLVYGTGATKWSRWIGGWIIPIALLAFGINALIKGRITIAGGRIFGMLSTEMSYGGDTSKFLACGVLALGLLFHAHYFLASTERLCRFAPAIKVACMLVLFTCMTKAFFGMLTLL